MQKINKKMLLAAWSVNNPYWIINQAYHIPLRKIFKDVKDFDPQEVIYQHGKEEMNRQFLDLLKSYRPDYIMLFLVWDEFYPETLIKIKEILPEVKVVQWNGDDDIKFENYTIPYSVGIDYQLISQLQFTDRYDAYKLPWFDLLGADTNKFRPLNLKKKYDVAFVGTPKGDRLKYLRYLLKKNVKFVLGGAGWDEYPEFREHYLGKIPDEKFIKLINESKINLCFSQNFFGVPHVIERSLAVNACKAFALTEYVSGYFTKFREGKDFASFKNEKELYEKITYYLENEKEREKIVKLAYEKVIKNFSNQKMLNDAFNEIEQDSKSLNGNRARTKYLNKSVLYLDKSDFNQRIDSLKNKTAKYDYICFTSKRYSPISHREFIQMYTMDLLKKPISICNAQLSSRLIGDYMHLDVYYSYHYLDRKYFYENIDLAQFMVEKNFFLKNVEMFKGLYAGKLSKFINPQNTSFISLPLVRTNQIKKIPFKGADHILFSNLNLNLLVLRNQKKIFRSPFLYKLGIYSFFINPQILKYFLINILPKTKNSILIKISHLFDRFFK